MADASTGFKHQTGKAAYRDVSPHPVLINNNKSAIENVDVAFFNEDN